jgi:hypothetical protein
LPSGRPGGSLAKEDVKMDAKKDCQHHDYVERREPYTQKFRYFCRKCGARSTDVNGEVKVEKYPRRFAVNGTTVEIDKQGNVKVTLASGARLKVKS